MLAVVTGAGRGIGRASALALAARGVDVVLLGRTAQDIEAARVAVLQANPQRRAVCVVSDVTSEPDVARAAKAITSDIGIPDVVVNNAGIVRRAKVHEQSLADFRAVVDTNLIGTFLVTRAFLPAMLGQRRGRFVQIASISATLGAAGAAAYAASKWGVVGFTKSLAEELRGTGLSTMSVLPGSVATAMLEGSGYPAAMTADEVAGLITYVALDAPAAMNGSAVEMFGA